MDEMKKWMVVCVALLLALPLLAGAEKALRPQDREPLALPMEVLDSPNVELSPALIMRMTAPNGQVLHFIAEFMHPVAYALDVNFDGAEDLAVLVSPGGTNEVYRLFIHQGERYVPVDDGQEEGLYNPAFFPESGLVLSHGVSGLAGALHEDILFGWEGARLIPLRSAVCAAYVEEYSQEDAYIIKTWADVLQAKVYAYRDGNLWDKTLMFEESFNMKTQGMEEAFSAFQGREQEALWQGLGTPDMMPEGDGNG